MTTAEILLSIGCAILLLVIIIDRLFKHNNATCIIERRCPKCGLLVEFDKERNFKHARFVEHDDNVALTCPRCDFEWRETLEGAK